MQFCSQFPKYDCVPPVSKHRVKYCSYSNASSEITTESEIKTNSTQSCVCQPRTQMQ